MTPTPTTRLSSPRCPYLPPRFDPGINWTDLYETVNFCAYLDTAYPIVVAQWRGAPFFTLVNLECSKTAAAMAFGALEFIAVERDGWEKEDEAETE